MKKEYFCFEIKMRGHRLRMIEETLNLFRGLMMCTWQSWFTRHKDSPDFNFFQSPYSRHNIPAHWLQGCRPHHSVRVARTPVLFLVSKNLFTKKKFNVLALFWPNWLLLSGTGWMKILLGVVRGAVETTTTVVIVVDKSLKAFRIN